MNEIRRKEQKENYHRPTERETERMKTKRKEGIAEKEGMGILRKK